MIEEHIEEKLKWFRIDKYKRLAAEDTITLRETQKDGRAKLHCTLTGEAIVLTSPEKNVLRYLDDEIKGATRCADVFIFKKNMEGLWSLHIIEFKKK